MSNLDTKAARTSAGDAEPSSTAAAVTWIAVPEALATVTLAPTGRLVSMWAATRSTTASSTGWRS